jgi:hypothetical protein
MFAKWDCHEWATARILFDAALIYCVSSVRR